MDWVFSGLGTAFISLIVGFITGGATGYKIGINKNVKIKQKQKAKDNASQIQVGRDSNGR